MLRAIHEIDLRLCRARYAKVLQSARVIHAAFNNYKVNRAINALRRKHYQSLGVARNRAAVVIQREWRRVSSKFFAFYGEWAAETEAEWRNGKNMSPDEAALMFAIEVGV